MSPVAWAVRPLKRYADFEGRSPRAEYWCFVLFQWLALAALFVIAVATGGDTKSTDPNPFFGLFIVPFVIGLLAVIIPNIAVQVRRLHDQDRSGWMFLLFLIPYIGGLISIVFMCIPGTRGSNRFGPDPYEDDYLGEVFA